MSALRSSASLRGRSGSASSLRPIATKSAAPSAMRASASCGSYRPMVITGTATRALTVAAWSRSGPTTCGAYESVGPVESSAYAVTCTASIPAATARSITCSWSSKRSPSSLCGSVALMRIHSGNALPTRARMARITSSRKRARPSRSPPQPSSRVVVGRQELVDQITVSGVHLDAVEAGAHTAVGGVGIQLDDRADVVGVRDAEPVRRPGPRERCRHGRLFVGSDHRGERIRRTPHAARRARASGAPPTRRAATSCPGG